MQNFNYGPLEIILSREEDKVLMSWTGQSIQNNPGITLQPYLCDLIDELGGDPLTIEFSALEYMNSSTVPPIIHFFKSLNSKGITTVVTYDASKKWQEATFKALKVLAGTMDNITVEPA